MANANIKAVITADDRASAVLKDFGDNANSVSNKVSNSFKLAGAAAVALGASGIALATKASWDQVDAVQQATVALRAYEKDGSKVNDVLKNLLSYARSDLGVLFNRKDLFQSAQSLRLMGDRTEDLVSHVQILSRSVGLGLSNWDELNLIVGRVGSTSRLTGEDFDNLTKAGYRIDPALRNTNITFQELFKVLDKGIPADALAGQANTIQGLNIRLQTAFRGVGDAILGVDADTNKFIEGGLGDRLMSGLAAATSNLRVLSSALREIIPDIQNLIVSVTAYLTPGLSRLVEVMGEVVTFMVGAFGPSLEALWNTLSTRVIPQIRELWNVLEPGLTTTLQIVAALLGGYFTAAFWVFINTANVAWSIIGFGIRLFNDLARGIGNLVGVAINAGAGLVSVFRAAFNAIAGLWNSTVGRLSFHAPSWVPVIGGKGFDVPNIPMMAEGGIVTKPTLAMIGEAGPEAVVPLNRGIASSTVNITIQAGAYMGSQQDARRYAKLIMNAYKDLMSAQGVTV